MKQYLRSLFAVSILIVVAFAATNLSAQPMLPGGNRALVDGVAAVVGNEIILVSDVLQQVTAYARQNKGADARDPKLQREILNALIDEKLVLTRAQEDSIVISDDELNRALEYQIRRITSQFGGSVERTEKAYGMSMDKIRRETREVIRQRLMVDQIRQRMFVDLKPTESDVQEFYRIYKDSLPKIDQQYELESIVLLAKPSADAKNTTIELAKRIIDSIKAGGDFADFARRYSEDPGSASAGGDNGFVNKGTFVPEYENAAKKLGINGISEPVESMFGVHIIQVLDRKGDATRSRHILLRVKQSPAERDSLMARLKDIRARAVAGEDFSVLARTYSQNPETRELGGMLGRFTADDIPGESKEAILSLKSGEITEPMPVSLSTTESGFQIIRLARTIAPHVLDPVQDRDKLERLATVYKQNREYDKWLAELRTEIYWEIKTPF